jgi:hypothetical protein
MSQEQHPYVTRAAWIGLLSCGIVGYNYAADMGIKPYEGISVRGILGGLVGGILGTFIVDENGHFKNFFAFLGGICGAFIGFGIGLSASGDSESQALPALVSALVGSVFGAALGQKACAFLAVVAILMLVFGRGVIGFAIRDWMAAQS